MATFEILSHESQKMIKATLQGETIRVESGALHYWRGQITMASSQLDAVGFFKSTVTGENVFRPTYTGHGEVYIGPPYFGEFAILEVEEGHPGWVLDRGAYVCSEEGVEVTIFRNSAMTALLGGEGLFQTLVRGKGQVVLRAPGDVQAIDLAGDTLAVDGSFAVAREAGLQYEVKRATASLFGSVTSGEGLLQYISGHGRVLLSPVPDVYQAVIDKIQAPQALGRRQIGSASGNSLQVLMGLVLVLVVFIMVCMGIFTAVIFG